MRLATVTAIAIAASISIVSAQMDAARKVAGGGIYASGWKGKVDAAEAGRGSAVNDSKFEGSNGNFTIASGPATTYWNAADTQTGDYTVSATFTEPSYMSAMSHPHSYGVFIGGNDLDSETPTLLYC